MARGQTGGFVVLRFEFNKENDGRWTAVCTELGTATFGDTFEEAQEDLQEAVALHLNTLEDVGERRRFFKENNITLHRVQPSKPPVVRNVPFSTLVQHNVQKLEFA